MKLIAALTACLTVVYASAANAVTDTGSDLEKMSDGLQALAEPHNPVGKLRVDSVVVDAATRTVSAWCGENVAYMQLTPTRADAIREAIRQGLPADARDYRINVTVGHWPLEQLTTKPEIKTARPSERDRFVIKVDGPSAPKGLDGKNIAMWQSHGWYYEPKLNRWEWQRARIFQTVEDLYTQSYVMPFVMPMLENAGAYVISPRERDTSRFEAIVDGDGGLAYPGYAETAGRNAWQTADGVTGFAYRNATLGDNENPFRAGSARCVRTVTKPADASTAVWSADIPAKGEYAVYVSYAPLDDAATDARYTIHTAAGDRHVSINQRMGAGTWIYLGHYPLKAGRQPVVSLSNLSRKAGAVVSADAVKVGGGMGNVARYVATEANLRDSIEGTPRVSGYPRFTEGARYFMQWAGIPDSVYTMSHNANDYTDDYRSRGYWVNYLAGGSSMVPDQKGLGIPVDMSFAFHSDAGTTRNDSIIGTLSIYCTNSDGNYDFPTGAPRIASRRLTDLVASEIVGDIRDNYEPAWTRRAMWDKNYAEARAPKVPAMLLELLSHQNFADMKYGLDPTFRFTVSRAIYKGILKFLAERDGRDYVVQPLPVSSFFISPAAKAKSKGKKSAGNYTLSWQPTPEKDEPTAMPSYYIVEERVGDGAFAPVARVDRPSYTVDITDTDIHSYRIIAGNDGGVSFPGEVLALRDNGKGGTPDMLIVNGFTRVSGPDTFDSDEIAGFYDARDHGVPYVRDISFIGSQFEFRRDIPWMDDDAAGFGASRANYEDKVVAGNTFDFVYTHGEAIAAAGCSFISSGIDAFAAADSLPAVKAIDLILGKQKEIKVGTGAYGTKYKTFTPAVQARLTDFCRRGGSVFVSGSYVATDLWDNPFSSAETRDADCRFATDVLGYRWRVGQATCEGNAYEVPSRFHQFRPATYDFSTILNEDCYAVESPDAIFAADAERGATILRYGENNLAAGTAFDAGDYRTVVIGFPFETISAADSRTSLMNQILNFFKIK